MHEYPSIPNAISHRQLNSLLSTSNKENLSKKDSIEYEKLTNQCEFKELLSKWSESSIKILELLQEEHNLICSDLSSKQTMSLGALQVHLNMAMQAKAAYEKE